MVDVSFGSNTGNTGSSVFSDLYLNDPNGNHDDTQFMQVTMFSAGDKKNCLIKFDLSSLPANISVSAASLSLNPFDYSADDGSDVRTLEMRRVLRDWVSTEATWNSYSTGNSWQTPGAYGSLDRSDTISATLLTDAAEADGAVEFTGAQLATDIENIASGAVPNFGWRLGVDDETTSEWYRAYRSPSATDGIRPTLDVTYTEVTDETLTAEQGSYTLTGQDAATRRTHILPADQGSYALTGQAATLRRTHVMTAEQGSYALTGQDATLTAAAPQAPAPAVGGGGGAPRFHPDHEREKRARRQDRHLRRTVEIASTGRVVSPDLMLDDSEIMEEDEALAVLVIGMLT